MKVKKYYVVKIGEWYGLDSWDKESKESFRSRGWDKRKGYLIVKNDFKKNKSFPIKTNFKTKTEAKKWLRLLK